MKSCERSITRLFLENIDTLQPIEDVSIEQEDLAKNKKDASSLLDTSSPNSLGHGERAARLLKKASNAPQTWSSIYQVIEEFRNDVRMRDEFSKTANPSQIGMASVLHILFSLVVETDLLIEPIDVNIIINTFKNNFTSEEQVDALEKLVDSIS